MQHDYLLPFLFKSNYLFIGVRDIKLTRLIDEVFVYVSYDMKFIKNKKMFFCLLYKEQYFHSYDLNKYLIVKLKIDNISSWYIDLLYHGGSDFISHNDLLHTFIQKIPAARESSRDLFLFVNFKDLVFRIFSHRIWSNSFSRIYCWRFF